MHDWVEVVVPQLGVNDDRVRLVAWRVHSGAPVSRGDILADVETSKAAFELTAEANGHFYPLVDEGAEVPIRAAVALLADVPGGDTVARYRKQHEADAPGPGAGDAPQLTVKARLLAERLGVEIATLPRGRILREDDIRALAAPAAAASISMPESGDAVIFGASQGGLVVAEAMRSTGRYHPVAFLDDFAELSGAEFEGLPVWTGAELAHLKDRGIIGVATHIARPAARLGLRARVADVGLAMLNVIHARAYVAPTVQMGQGNLIKAGAIVDDYVTLEDCVIVDNGAVVPHHNRIASGCHIAPGACFGGDCVVGEETIIGVGAVIAPRIHIGRRCIIGAGAVVTRDLPDHTIVEPAPGRHTTTRR